MTPFDQRKLNDGPAEIAPHVWDATVDALRRMKELVPNPAGTRKLPRTRTRNARLATAAPRDHVHERLREFLEADR
jgi:hypothetical protein